MAKKAVVASTPRPTPLQENVAKITRRLTGEPESKSVSLPFADQEVAEKIDAANSLRKEISGLESVLKAAKEDFISTVMGLDVPGLRTASTAIIVNIKSRTSLSKEKLLTKLTAEELAECYEDGASYYEVRFQDIKEGS